MIPLDQQIREVAREIAMRRNVYPKFVASGRLTQAKADAQIAAMEAVIETLKSVQERPSIGEIAATVLESGER